MGLLLPTAKARSHSVERLGDVHGVRKPAAGLLADLQVYARTTAPGRILPEPRRHRRARCRPSPPIDLRQVCSAMLPFVAAPQAHHPGHFQSLVRQGNRVADHRFQRTAAVAADRAGGRLLRSCRSSRCDADRHQGTAVCLLWSRVVRLALPTPSSQPRSPTCCLKAAVPQVCPNGAAGDSGLRSLSTVEPRAIHDSSGCGTRSWSHFRPAPALAMAAP